MQAIRYTHDEKIKTGRMTKEWKYNYIEILNIKYIHKFTHTQINYIKTYWTHTEYIYPKRVDLILITCKCICESTHTHETQTHTHCA